MKIPLAIVSVSLAIGIAVVVRGQNPDVALSRNGMVVTSQKEATRVGLDILRAGGNAIDAAVAVGYALAVTEPCCGNLGGGGFMLLRLADGTTTFINFRETAPLAATADMYLDKTGAVIPNRSRDGYLAVAVPGTVKGLELALSKYGTLSREQVMDGAIQLAERGFVLEAGDVEMMENARDKLTRPSMAAIFLKNGSTLYEVGDRLVQKDLARTLQQIAREGPDAFYRGSIAERLVAASRQNGGILSVKDLATYEARQQPPARCTYRGREILTAPPPGGGVTVCLMLNILQGYDLKGWGFRSIESVHRFLASMLFAYVDRNTYLGDPRYVRIPVYRLLSPEYAASIRDSIPSAKAVDPAPFYRSISREGDSTTHYSVIDRQGNAVAVTYTINSHFGAGVIAGDTGFILNNEMDDFAAKLGSPNQFGLIQGQANRIEPGKQPLSSMSPTLVLQNDRTVLITGSPGGSTIPTTVVQVITNTIDYGMPIERAVNFPRIHYQGMPDTVSLETGALSSEAVRKLEQMGYRFQTRDPWGSAGSIAVDPEGNFTGASDRRRSAGAAMGF
jgi:gamma-glutamyltranspeptidase/glutathione hydrolase